MIYFIPGSCTEADMIEHHRQRSSGGEWRKIINSQEQCVGECLGDANCRGADWNLNGLTCVIHFDQSELDAPNQNDLFTQYIKPASCV